VKIANFRLFLTIKMCDRSAIALQGPRRWYRLRPAIVGDLFIGRHYWWRSHFTGNSLHGKQLYYSL